MSLNRRTFLKQATVTAAVLGAARLAPAIATPDSPGLTDLVPLLIETDRDQLLEALVARIRGGLDYPTMLGAVAEASVRQVRPYPHVGFKYHAFMVLQAVHRTTTLGRPEDRWLPVLWAADVFKGAQAAEQRSGSWSLGPVRERLVPPAHKAEGAFRDAMERWDPEAADAAVVGLARSLPRDRLFALLVPLWGARLPRHRTQGDHRRQLSSAAGRRRPGAHRAHAAIAGPCPAEPRGRAEPGGQRPGPGSSVAPESCAREPREC